MNVFPSSMARQPRMGFFPKVFRAIFLQTQGRISNRKTSSGYQEVLPSAPPAYEPERNYEIFPSGIDAEDPPESLTSMGYAPGNLSELFLRNANHRIEDILVVSAEYFKEKKSPGHEFILLEVVDRYDPVRLRNFLVLDRTSGAAGGLASSHTKAQDRFKVSCNGDKASLTKECGLDPHKRLESMNFSVSTSPLPLYKLVVLATVTSTTRDMYDLRNHNCYWFACSVWDCMLNLHPSSHDTNKKKRGKFFGIRVRSMTNHVDDIMSRFYVDMPIFLLNLRRRKQAIAQSFNETERQRYDRIKQEITELEEKLGIPNN